MDHTIYMPLVGEGTECWRPVRGVPSGDGAFEVIDDIPEGESWAFTPFSRVRCRDKVFTDGRTGLVICAYAIESHPCYRLLKDHEGQIIHIFLANGEKSVVRVFHVDEQHEDFIYGLLSTSVGSKYCRDPKEASFVAKFADLVSARPEG